MSHPTPPDVTPSTEPSSGRDEPDAARSGTIVRRGDGAAPVPRGRLARNVATLRARLPELARNPAVVATATVGTTLAVGAVRQALRGSALLPGGAPRELVVNAHIIEHVHVVHHVVVHHVVRTAVPSVRR
jgi:hypothetical protein